MTDNADPPPRFPLYVRVLAVAHVLSLVVGPGAFFVCVIAGCLRWRILGGVDAGSMALIALGLAAPALGALYRRWFESWGRANWPDGQPDRF